MVKEGEFEFNTPVRQSTPVNLLIYCDQIYGEIENLK